MFSVRKAIGDETRFRILKKISQAEICACELPSFAKVSQPAVSQHLKILLDSGLVSARKEGVKRIYSTTQKAKQVLADIGKW